MTLAIDILTYATGDPKVDDFVVLLAQILGQTVDQRTARTITQSATVSDNDRVVFIDAAYTDVTLTLPSAKGFYGYYVVGRVDGGANAATMQTVKGQTINGATSRTLASQYLCETIQSDGANWVVVATSA